MRPCACCSSDGRRRARASTRCSPPSRSLPGKESGAGCRRSGSTSSGCRGGPAGRPARGGAGPPPAARPGRGRGAGRGLREAMPSSPRRATRASGSSTRRPWPMAGRWWPAPRTRAPAPSSARRRPVRSRRPPPARRSPTPCARSCATPPCAGPTAGVPSRGRALHPGGPRARDARPVPPGDRGGAGGLILIRFPIDRSAISGDRCRDAEIGFAHAPRGLALRNPEAIVRIAYQSR